MSNNTLAIINPANALSVRTYKNSETRTYGGALKFIPFCESEGLDNSNSTHAERVLKHSKHCNDVNSKGQALLSNMASQGLVFDKASVNTNEKDGVRRVTVSYVKVAVPKEKVKKEAKLAQRVTSASPETLAKIEALLKAEEANTITVS
jgi:hypothetical protein